MTAAWLRAGVAALATAAAAAQLTVEPLTNGTVLYENNTEVIIEYRLSLGVEPNFTNGTVDITAVYDTAQARVVWPDETDALNASIFGPGNWSVPQTVEVHTVDNDYVETDIDFELMFIAASPDPVYNGTNATFNLTNYDDDWPWVDADHPGVREVPENTTDPLTYTLALSSGVPTQDVVVKLASTDTSAGTVTPSVVTFTPGSWQQRFTVSVSFVDDVLLDGPQAFVIDHVVSSADPLFDALSVGIHKYDPTTFGFTAVDNEEAALVQTSASPCNETDAECTYAVSLALEPVQDVSIDVSLNAPPAWGYNLDPASPATLVFTSMTWNTPQTVAVQFTDDQTQYDNRTVVLSHAIRTGNPGFDTYTPPNVTLLIMENDEADVVLGQMAGSTYEDPSSVPPGQGSTIFDLALATAPQHDVYLWFVVETPANCRLESVGADPEVTPLTFTAGTWNTPQSITMHAVNNLVDDVDEGLPCRLRFNVTSEDVFFNNMTMPMYGTTTVDDDVAGVTITNLGGAASDLQLEAATLGVVLDSEPIADVTVTLSSTDTTKCIVRSGEEVIAFNTTNWNAVQNTSVLGVPNQAFDFGQSCTIVSATASADPKYDPCPQASLTLTTRNDERPQMNSRELNDFNASAPGAVRYISENGTLAWEIAVQLETRPDSAITVTAETIVDGVADDTEAALVFPVFPDRIDFSQVDYTQWQTVTVLPKDDYKDDGDKVVTVRFTVAADFDLNYDGLTYDFPITNIDNDTLEFHVEYISGNTFEWGGDNTSDVNISLQLATLPDADVTASVTSSDETEVVITAGTQLVFTQADWNVTQIISIRGVNDHFVDGNITLDVVLACTSADMEWAGYTQGIEVVNEDRFDTERATSRNFSIDVVELTTGWACPPEFAVAYAEDIESLDACRLWCEENTACVAYTYQDHWAAFTRLARCRLYSACPLANREWLNVYEAYVGSFMHRIAPAVVWQNETERAFAGAALDNEVITDYRAHFGTAFNASHEWTVAVQVKPTNFYPTGAQAVFSTLDASGVRGFRLAIEERRWVVHIGDGERLQTLRGPHVVYHVFTHIHLAFSPGIHEAGILLLYVDGVLAAERWAAFMYSQEPFTTGGSTVAEVNAGNGLEPFTGAMKGFTAWDRYLDLTLLRTQLAAASGKVCPPGPPIALDGAPSWFLNNHSANGVLYDGRCVYLFEGDATCAAKCKTVSSACDGDGLDVLTTAPSSCEAAMQRLGVGYTHVHRGDAIGRDPTGLFPVDRATGGCAATPHGELLFSSPHGSCHTRLNITHRGSTFMPSDHVDFAQVCVCDDTAPPPPPTLPCDTGACEHCPVAVLDAYVPRWRVLAADGACGTPGTTHTATDLAACRKLCEADPTCVAVDHFSWDATCVLLTAACGSPGVTGNGSSSHARTPDRNSSAICADAAAANGTNGTMGNGTAVIGAAGNATAPINTTLANSSVCDCQKFCANESKARGEPLPYAQLHGTECVCLRGCEAVADAAGTAVGDVLSFAVPEAAPRDVCEPHGMQRVNQNHTDDRMDLGAMDLARDGGFAFSGWFRADGGVVAGASKVPLAPSTRWRVTAADATGNGWSLCDFEFYGDDACMDALPELFAVQEVVPATPSPFNATINTTLNATDLGNGTNGTNSTNQTITTGPGENATYFVVTRYPPQPNGDFGITDALFDAEPSTCRRIHCGDNGGTGCPPYGASFIIEFSQPETGYTSANVHIEREGPLGWIDAWTCAPGAASPQGSCPAPADAAEPHLPALPDTRPVEIFHCAAADGDVVSLVVENSTVRYTVTRSPRAMWAEHAPAAVDVMQWDLPFAPLRKDATYHHLGVIHKGHGHVSLLVDMVEVEDTPYHVEPPAADHAVRALDGLLTVRFASDNFNWTVTPQFDPAAPTRRDLPYDPYPWVVYQRFWPPPEHSMVEFLRWGVNGTNGTAEPLRNGSFPIWVENTTPRGKWGAARFGHDDGGVETHTGLKFPRPIAEIAVNATQYGVDNPGAVGVPPNGTTIFAVINPAGGAPTAHLLDAGSRFGILANEDKIACWVGEAWVERAEVAAFAPFPGHIEGWLLVACRVALNGSLELRVNTLPAGTAPVPPHITANGTLVDEAALDAYNYTGERTAHAGPDVFGYRSRLHPSQANSDPNTWDPQDNTTVPRTGDYYVGQVAEFRVYGKALHDDQITSVERWLAAKYFGGQFMKSPPPGLREHCFVGGNGDGNVSDEFVGTVRDVLVFAEDITHQAYGEVVADGTVEVKGTTFARGFGCTSPHHCEERGASGDGGAVARENLQLDWISRVPSYSTIFEGTVMLRSLPTRDAPLFTFGGRGCGAGGISAWAFRTDGGRFDLGFGAMGVTVKDRPAAVLTQEKLSVGTHYTVRFEVDVNFGGGTHITYSADDNRYPPPLMRDFHNVSGVWDTFDGLCLGEAPCVGTHPDDMRFGLLTSPDFILTTSSEVEVDSYGAPGENVSISGLASANRTGFAGVGLYDIVSGRYLAWRARSGYQPVLNASGAEVSQMELLAFRAHELRGFAGRRVRVDLIDDYCTPFHPVNNTRRYHIAGTWNFTEVPSQCNTGRGWTGYGKVVLRQVNSTRASARVTVNNNVAGFQRLYIPHPLEAGDVSLLTRCHNDPSAGGLDGDVVLTLGCPKSSHVVTSVWCEHNFDGAGADYAHGGPGSLGDIEFGGALSASLWVRLDSLQNTTHPTALFDTAAAYPVGTDGPTETDRVALEWRDGNLHYTVSNLRPQRRNEDEDPHGTETQHEIVAMAMPVVKSADPKVPPVRVDVPRTAASTENVTETLEFVGCFSSPVLFNQSATEGAGGYSLRANAAAARLGGWEYIAMANDNNTAHLTGLGGSFLLNGLYGAGDLRTSDCMHEYVPCEAPNTACGCAGVTCEGYALASGRCTGSVDVTNTPPAATQAFLSCMRTLQSWAVWRRVEGKVALPVDGKWHHVALVHHNDLSDHDPAAYHERMKLGTAVLTVDGVEVRADRVILPNAARRDRSRLGRSNKGGGDLHGFMREFYLWDDAVPVADLHAVAHRTMQPFLPQARLVVAGLQNCNAPPLGYGQCLTGDTTNVRDPRLCDRPICECQYNGFWCAVSAWRWGDTTEYWEGAWAADPTVNFDGVQTPRLEKARCYMSSDTPERCACHGDVVMHAYNPLKTKVQNLDCASLMRAFGGRLAPKLPMEVLVPTPAGMVLCPNIYRRTINDFAPNTIHERGIRF